MSPSRRQPAHRPCPVVVPIATALHYTRALPAHRPCPVVVPIAAVLHYARALLERRDGRPWRLATRALPPLHPQNSHALPARRYAPLPCAPVTPDGAPVTPRSQPHVLEQGKNTQWQGHRKRTVSRTTAKGGKIRRPLLLGKHRNPCRRTNGERRRRQT